MKQFIAVILLLWLVNAGYAQQKDTAATDVEFNTVQVEATFPGGVAGWKNYLEQNLNVSLADSCLKLKKGEKMARQTVIVSFMVDKSGKISNVQVENASSVHPLLAAEAIRVIKNGPDWIPARQNNRAVIYRQRQSITWVLTD